jgi:hypothetical protein
MTDIWTHLKEMAQGFFRACFSGAVDFEVAEARNLFSVLVFAPLFGVPLLPAAVSLELLPYVEKRLAGALARLSELDDALGLLAGHFDIE